MGMPELDISSGEYELVEGLVQDHGRRLDAEPYEVVLKDGSREIVAISADTFYGSQGIVDGLQQLLSGVGLFGNREEVDLSTVPPETSLRDFLNNPRLAGILSRHGNLKTLGDLRAFLEKAEGLDDLDAIRGIGSESVAVVRAALGM